MSDSDKIQRLLIEKAEQTAAGAAVIISTTNDWMLIREFMCNRSNLKLTPEQQKKLDRYQYAYAQLSSGKYTRTQVVNLIMNMYSVGLTQAYEDLRCCKELFTAIAPINKQWEINTQLEVAKMAAKQALEMNDYKGYAMIQKRVNELIAMQPDEEDTPGELFEGITIEAVFDPRSLGAPDVNMQEVLRAINEKRNTKINIDMYEELDHEDIPNENDKTTL